MNVAPNSLSYDNFDIPAFHTQMVQKLYVFPNIFRLSFAIKSSNLHRAGMPS